MTQKKRRAKLESIEIMYKDDHDSDISYIMTSPE